MLFFSLFLDMAFDLPFYIKLNSISFNCMYNPALNKTEWMYQKPDQTFATQPPECKNVCNKCKLFAIHEQIFAINCKTFGNTIRNV